jgi:type I restriction enzyme R subunit
MDFRSVTNLFADPNFDGDPVMIKDVTEDDDISGTDDETTDEPIVDVVDGGDVEFPPEYPTVNGGGFIVAEPNPREKIRVNGVEVRIVNERVQYLGADGRIITESLKDYTKKNVIEKYATLETFLNSWKNADKKKAIVEALEQQGIFFEALKEEIGKDFDPFDLICHVAFEAKPLTRKERANNVKKRNYFTKYGEKAQSVIKSLLDKYADDDLLTIESLDVLKLDPLNKLGSPLEIINAFGGKENYIQALKELENELYKVA